MKIISIVFVLLLTTNCTQEQQNKISRNIQNWTGANGTLDVFSNGKVMYRFINIDKLSTATATSGSNNAKRDYRFGYGIYDLNQNFIKDTNEKKTYFEVPSFSNYVFYETPQLKK